MTDKEVDKLIKERLEGAVVNKLPVQARAAILVPGTILETQSKGLLVECVIVDYPEPEFEGDDRILIRCYGDHRGGVDLDLELGRIPDAFRVLRCYHDLTITPEVAQALLVE